MAVCLSCWHPDTVHGPQCRDNRCPCPQFEPLSACRHESSSGDPDAPGGWVCDQCGEGVAVMFEPRTLKFRVHQMPNGTWALDYQTGFTDSGARGEYHPAHTQALAALLACMQRWCPMCGRGTMTGWVCTTCGCTDEALP